MASEEISESNEPFKAVKSLMKQSLLRDEGWKEFYKEEMDKIEPVINQSKIYETLILERKAAVLNYAGNYEKASELIQEIIDKTKAIQGEDFFDYIVEGSELRICIDNEYVLFFNWRTETTEDDFRWTTTKFLEFMEGFKEFLKENGR